VRQLVAEAERLADVLRRHRLRVVFAESCTAGLLAATLARVPGISEFLCGSAVVYRNATKAAWLGVPQAALDDPAVGPVSREVARHMALGVLAKTPEADLAASITGHLGPDAPPEQDGVLYVGIARRPAVGQAADSASVQRFQLPPAAPETQDAVARRLLRQQEAARLVLVALAEAIHQTVTPARP
jgi:PncC family amidohydrolase